MQHKPITDKWLLKEIQFNQRHEEILMCREALLRGTETFYDVQAHQAASFISDATKARDRNEQLLKDFHQFQTDFEHAIATPETPKFQTLRNNYWAMVKNVFPVWQEELKEFYRRQNMKTSPNASRRQKSPSHKGQRSATLPRANSQHKAPGMKGGGHLRGTNPVRKLEQRQREPATEIKTANLDVESLYAKPIKWRKNSHEHEKLDKKDSSLDSKYILEEKVEDSENLPEENVEEVLSGSLCTHVHSFTAKADNAKSIHTTSRRVNLADYDDSGTYYEPAVESKYAKKVNSKQVQPQQESQPSSSQFLGKLQKDSNQGKPKAANVAGVDGEYLYADPDEFDLETIEAKEFVVTPDLMREARVMTAAAIETQMNRTNLQRKVRETKKSDNQSEHHDHLQRQRHNSLDRKRETGGKTVSFHESLD